MIHFVEHKDIDKLWWDETLAKAANKMPYASSWMLDAVAPDWNALIDKENGIIMPLPWRKKYGIKYVFQPFPLQQLGVFSPTKLNAEIVDDFLDKIPKTYKKIDLQLNWACRTGNTYFRIEEMTNTTLEIDGSIEEIRARYSKNHKRSIKKHNTAGAEIRNLDDPNLVLRAFEQWKLPELKGEKVEWKNVAQLIEACEKRNCGAAYASYLNDELVCAAYFIVDMGRVIYLKGASNENGKRIGAMHAIMDRVIHQHAGTQCLFDFGGSNNPSLTRFYTGFGAQVSIYLHVVKEAFSGLKKRIKFRK